MKVHPEGKFVVDVDKNIDINDVSVVVVILVIARGRKFGFTTVFFATYLHSCLFYTR